MRLTDHRHARDLRRYALALRMLQHEARRQTLVQWTGLSADRITKLANDHRTTPAHRPSLRLRGHSPYQVAFFFRSTYLAAQAAVLAGYCQQLDVFPAERGPTAARHLPGLRRGEQLCESFEFYRAALTRPLITFEHAILLVTALVRGDELALATCGECSALFLRDCLATPQSDCTHCRPTSHLPWIPGDRSHERTRAARPIQLPLFPDGPCAAHSSSSGKPPESAPTLGEFGSSTAAQK